MERLVALFESGQIFALVLALLTLEALLLVLATTAARISRAARWEIAANLAAGAGLLAAAMFVVTAAAWYWSALSLAIALAAHVFDLQQRLARARRESLFTILGARRAL